MVATVCAGVDHPPRMTAGHSRHAAPKPFLVYGTGESVDISIGAWSANRILGWKTERGLSRRQTAIEAVAQPAPS